MSLETSQQRRRRAELKGSPSTRLHQFSWLFCTDGQMFSAKFIFVLALLFASQASGLSIQTWRGQDDIRHNQIQKVARKIMIKRLANHRMARIQHKILCIRLGNCWKVLDQITKIFEISFSHIGQLNIKILTRKLAKH